VEVLFFYAISAYYHNMNDCGIIINHIYDVCNKNPVVKNEYDKKKEFYESHFAIIMKKIETE